MITLQFTDGTEATVSLTDEQLETLARVVEALFVVKFNIRT